MKDAQLMTITPELASRMLKNNTNNRKLKPTTVDAYASMMKSGDWIISTDMIGFDVSGTLVNGQHRLAACAKSGCTIEAYVGYGFEPNTFSVIDQQAIRTTQDIAKDREPWIKDSAVIGCIRYLAYELGIYSIKKCTPAMTLKLMNEYRGIARMVYDISIKRRGKNKLSRHAPTLAAIVAAKVNGIPDSACDGFLAVGANDVNAIIGGYNVNAALDYINYKDKHSSSSQPVRMALYERAKVAIYLFAHRMKSTSKSSPYDITKSMFNVYNAKLIREYGLEEA